MTKTTGYKNTPIGLIPTDWELKLMKDVCKVNQGLQIPISKRFSDKIENSDFYITNEFLKENSKNQYFILNAPDSVKCTKDDILMTRTGNTGAVVTNVEGAFHNNFFKIKYDLDLLQKNYLVHFLTYPKTLHKILVLAGNSTIPDLNHSDFYRLIIPLPPLPEQQKIAEILSAWDKAIQDTDAIIKKLEVRNKALAFSLLTGKKRVKGFEENELKKTLANEVFKSVSIKSNSEDSILLSATQEFGMIPRDMVETRVTMPSGSLKTYKLVEKGDFVISLRSFQGGIEYSEYTGVVSPAYTVLKSINPINNDFYKYYFKSEDLIGRLSVAVIGIRDGKNISYDDFSTIVLPNPSLEEQNAIAEILNFANQESKQYQQKLEALKLQKKGLMQQLLTGKMRVVWSFINQNQI